MMLTKIAAGSMTFSICYIFLASFFEASTWENFPAYVSSGSDVVMATAAFTGVFLWKGQIKFNRKHDLADRVLDLADELASSLICARNPFSAPGELEEVVNSIGGYADEHHKLVIARLIETDRPRLELIRLKRKIQRHFGEEALDSIQELISMVYELKRHYDQMARIRLRIKNSTSSQSEIIKLEEEYQVISEHLSGFDDEFEAQIENNLAAIDTLLGDYIN